MPTLMGRDSDDPRSLGEVGHCGVAIDSAADMDVLFEGIPLAGTTTSMTISGPAVPIFCMYLVAAERQGADLSKLTGPCRPTSSRSTSRRRSGCSSPSRTCASSAT
jgi:Methylmalonyl-CoA mutase, N-terminal domain/subunit